VRAFAWALVGLTVLAQISYPLVGGDARTVVTIATVCLGFAAAVFSAAATRGVRVAGLLVLITAGGGLLVEAVGTKSGFPFGPYAYTSSLGPKVAGVPWVIPLAWTMMAWPAWLVAGRLAGTGWRRVLVAGWGLASWDLFLDPQMVAAGHWVWRPGGGPGLPGVPGIPWTNYAGWLVVGIVMMAVLPRAALQTGSDSPMYAFYLWTYASSVLAHAAFFGLPASAAWGGVGMGLVAIPLAVRLSRPALPPVRSGFEVG
jgi:putative membrane protein